MPSDGNSVAARTEFIQLRDIRRIQKEIEAENIRLAPDDGLSTQRWVEILRTKGHLLGFKSKLDPPPGSGLALDHGEHLLCIDATHNVTMYENLNLTTLLVRNKRGHGIPISWMLSSSGTQQTIEYFLRLHRAQNPLTIPRNIMSDFDWPQIHACSVMWSGVYRTARNIYEACDTNMLIEAQIPPYKRNRRLDHLLHTLLNDVLPYYALKQRRQELGFEGPDLEVKKRKDIIKRSKVYVKDDIQQISDSKYLVPSQSNPSKLYEYKNSLMNQAALLTVSIHCRLMTELDDVEFFKAMLYERASIGPVGNFAYEVLQVFYATPVF
ncbi:hypothetical protein C8J57DRAFT_1528679 [Mycena rebaudengoi]|nr:hypothetical protein C8J57DRAFT_1528679 [Mycena rebaudengoi]